MNIKSFAAIAAYALGDLVEVFGQRDGLDCLCPGRTWHDALYDACACALLAAHFMSDGMV